MRRYAVRDKERDRIKAFWPADSRLFVEAVLYRYPARVPWRATNLFLCGDNSDTQPSRSPGSGPEDGATSAQPQSSAHPVMGGRTARSIESNFASNRLSSTLKVRASAWPHRISL